ncbi:hypothetical protein Ancab_030149 [Ancistrocladus abbreviatus]
MDSTRAHERKGQSKNCSIAAPEDEDLGSPAKKIRSGISADIIAELTDWNAALLQQRKKRAIPSTLASIEDVEHYTQFPSFPLHKTSKPGILTIDVHYAKIEECSNVGHGDVFTKQYRGRGKLNRLEDRERDPRTGRHMVSAQSEDVLNDQSCVLSCAAAQTVLFQAEWDLFEELCEDGFCLHSFRIISSLSGHSKKVTSVKVVPDDDSLVITGSADKTVQLWQGSENGNYVCRHILKDHSAEVQAVTVHATKQYFVTASLNNSWCFYDPSHGLCLTQVKLDLGGIHPAFHPDSLILGTGTSEAVVKIWDVKSQAESASGLLSSF